MGGGDFLRVPKERDGAKISDVSLKGVKIFHRQLLDCLGVNKYALEKLGENKEIPDISYSDFRYFVPPINR